MKALPTLMRIAKRDLDTLRQALGEIERRRGEIGLRIAALEQSIANEQKAALATYESSRAYGGFAAAAFQQRRALEAQARTADEEATAMRAVVADAHVELKKLERLLELEGERARSAEKRADNAEMDELATLRAARTR